MAVATRPTTSTDAAGRHVALLRGINVGGKNGLPMRALAQMFEEEGCTDVRTYIQSGNVVFRAPLAVAKRLPKTIAERIANERDLRVPLVMRTATEWHELTRSNPFVASGEAPEALHVMFLATEPAAAAGAALDPNRLPPDCFVLRGRDIYLFCPNGVARTKLTNDYFDRTLATTSTGRNWRTVLTLAQMLGEV